MAIVFKTPKSTLNTTSKQIQNVNGDCPPCPECPEVKLESGEANYTENGEYTLTPEGDGFSKVDITVNVDTETPYNEGYAAGEEAGYAAGETAGIATGKAEGIAEQKAKLTSVTLTENGTSTREDGWNSVTVNVDVTTPYNNGVVAGEAAQKAKLTSLNVTSNGTYSKEDGYNSVTVAVPSDINNQNKTVNPLTSSQSISADSGYSGLGTVTVNAVTSSIDNNISAGNIKKDVTILGVTGSYDPQPALANANVVPATSAQTITPPAGIDGYSRINVTAVTAAIDANIVAENILDGVTILGVTGTDMGYDAGYSDGYAQGQAECPEPGGCDNTAYVQETITTNGTYTYDPSDYQGDSYDAFDGVEITVNVPSSGCVDWASMGWNCQDVIDCRITADVAYTASVKDNNN